MNPVAIAIYAIAFVCMVTGGWSVLSACAIIVACYFVSRLFVWAFVIVVYIVTLWRLRSILKG